MLLPAFNKAANYFEEVEKPSDNGFESPLLNDILFVLPKLREPVKELLGAVSIKRAAEGNKESMWTDPERYPGIQEAELVGIIPPEGSQADMAAGNPAR